MPNTGKPSRDCHLCRQRRVKCDLARPSCQRCIKYGAECPGYRDEQDILFRHVKPANLKRGKAKASRPDTKQGSSGPSKADAVQGNSPVFITWQASDGASDNGSSTSSHTLVHRGSVTPTTPWPGATSPPYRPDILALPKDIREDWTMHSIPLLLDCYSSVSVLGRIYNEILALKNDAFMNATHLWARTYLSNRFHAPQDPRENEICVSKALGSLAIAMRDQRMAVADSTIMSVWLLGMYELQIGGIGKSSRSTWSVHADGLTSILRARGPDQFFWPNGRQIFWSVYTVIQTNCIIHARECPAESEAWLDILEGLRIPDESLVLRVSRYIVGACKVLCTVMPWLLEGNFVEACANWTAIVDEVDVLEQQMLDWLALATTPELDAGPVMGHFWNSWRCARLKLQHTTMLLSNIVQYGPVPSPVPHTVLESRRKNCSLLIATTAQHIIASMPVSLGGLERELRADIHGAWFEGMRTIWPLTNIYTVRTVPRELRLVAKRALISIGKDIGILQALKSQPGQMPYVPEALVGIPMDETVEGPRVTELLSSAQQQPQTG